MENNTGLPEPPSKEQIRIQQLEQEATQAKAELQELRKLDALRQETASPEFNFLDPDSVAELMQSKVIYSGTRLQAKDGRSVRQLLEDFIVTKPYHVRPKSVELAPPANATPNVVPGIAVPLTKLFGKTADPKLANRLAMEDIVTYRKLKAKAQAQGII